MPPPHTCEGEGETEGSPVSPVPCEADASVRKFMPVWENGTCTQDHRQWGTWGWGDGRTCHAMLPMVGGVGVGGGMHAMQPMFLAQKRAALPVGRPPCQVVNPTRGWGPGVVRERECPLVGSLSRTVPAQSQPCSPPIFVVVLFHGYGIELGGIEGRRREAKARQANLSEDLSLMHA